MITSAYNDGDTIIGDIFDTGCNAAYLEDCGLISQLRLLEEYFGQLSNGQLLQVAIGAILKKTAT